MPVISQCENVISSCDIFFLCGYAQIRDTQIAENESFFGDLVSFCGEGIKKIGPTTFEMVKEDFWPQEELNILILERQPAT